jgi:hypothetical protein
MMRGFQVPLDEVEEPDVEMGEQEVVDGDRHYDPEFGAVRGDWTDDDE